MNDTTTNDVAEALKALRAELARLGDRVTALEAAARIRAAGGATVAAATPPPRPAEEKIPDEVLLVISAAVAAFLGKKPRIRGIRVVTSPEWARQGRMHIQASHARAHSGR